MARVLLCTQGSLGDLHPMLGLGRELNRRGHAVRVATNPFYEEKVEGEGLEYVPAGPKIDPTDYELVEKVVDPVKGSAHLVRDIVVPHLRRSFRDFRRAANGVDLLVSSPITPTVRLVARLTDRPWVSTVFSPVSMWSKEDPPALPPFPGFIDWPVVGTRIMGLFMDVGRWFSRGWFREYERLCEELGLDVSGHPLLEGQHSPYRVLALFSRQLAAPQSDWPEQTLQPGFVFYDRGESQRTGDSLDDFLDSGDPPWIVTLGSAACLTERAARVYESALEAAESQGTRLVLITGPRHYDRFASRSTSDVFVTDYAPYSEVFPRAGAILHQGGAGTAGQAMRAGRPMVVVPFAHDQFDHARRLERRGVGMNLPCSRCDANRLGEAMERLRTDPAFERNAAEVGEAVRDEDGTQEAVRALEVLGEAPSATVPTEA